MTKHVVYGLGGYDETKPNNNVVEEYEIEDSPETLAEQTQIANLNSARMKLSSLGLNDDEVNAILGVSDVNN